MSKDDGGPAFPTVKSNKPNTASTMRDSERSKRDWFAGMAMQGFCANPDRDIPPGPTAEIAYEQADAMLAEGNKGQASEVQNEL